MEFRIVDLPEQETLLLAKAKDAITNAVRNGATADLALVEALALRLAIVRIDIPEQLRLMLDAVRYFYLSGRAFTGLPIAQRARALAVESADSSTAVDALLLIGVCAADAGDLPTAMEAYADGLRLATATNDPVRECKIWQNLGAALMNGGLYGEEIGRASCRERV